MKYWLAFPAVWIALAQPAAAEVDCKIIGALSRIAELDRQNIGQSPGLTLSQDLQLDLRRLDSTGIRYQMHGELSESEIDAIAALIEITERIVALAADRRQIAIIQLLQDPRSQQIVSRAESVLSQIPCDGDQSQQMAQATGDADDAQHLPPGQATSDVRSGVRLDIAVKLLIYGGVFLTIIAGGLGFWLYRIQQAKSRRNGRRYNINLATNYIAGALKESGDILDISCIGAKLRHKGKLDGVSVKTIDIQIAGEWHEGHVKWQNKHYVGLAFAKPLKFRNVLAILSLGAEKKTSGSGHPETETAPSRAPS